MTTEGEQNGSGKVEQKKGSKATNNAAKILDQLFQSSSIEENGGVETSNPQAELTLDERMQELQMPGVLRVEKSEILHVPLDLLLDNPFQPREEIEKDQDYWDFVADIKQYKVLGAVPARKSSKRKGCYELAWGHRRREASHDAGLKTLPITVEDLDDAVMAALAAIENVHRKDLTDFELGKLFKNMNENGWTQEQIAKRVSKDRGFVVNRLRLVTADQDIQAHVRRKRNSLRAVGYLIKVKDSTDRALLYPRLEDGRLTVDDLAGDIDELLKLIKDEEATQKKDDHLSNAVNQITSQNVGETTTLPSENSPSWPQLPSYTEEKESDVPLPLPTSSQHQLQSPEMAEREQIRIASTKLRRILSGLQSIASENQEREQLSQAEINYLKEIGEIYKQLCERAQIDIDTILGV